MTRTIRTSPDAPLPRELSHSAPRDVILTSTGTALVVTALTMVTGAVALALLLWGMAEREAERAAVLATEARNIQATVVRVRRPGGDNSRWTVDYRYTVAGREHHGRAKLRKRDPRGAGAAFGSPFAVQYLESRPHESWVEGYPPRAFPHWVAILIPAVLVLGAVPIWWAIRRQRWLLAEGRAARARVIGTRKADYGYGAQWRVDYEWNLLSGAARKGHFGGGSKPPVIGSRVAIVYDRDNPARHARYPLSLVRVRPGL